MVLGLIPDLAWATSRRQDDASAGINVLLGQTYDSQPAANYVYAADAAGKALTNGQAAAGRFWTNGQTAGWTWRSPVVIRFDVKQTRVLDRVRVQIGASTEVGILYPTQILVFGGNGTGRYRYLASSEILSDEHSPRGSGLEWTEIQFASVQVSEVLVTVFARGGFAFLGEVEALTAHEEGKLLQPDLPSLDAVRERAVLERRAAVGRLAGSMPTGPDISRRWAMPLDAQQMNAAPSTSKCSVNRVDPWTLDPITTPVGTPALVTSLGGRDYAAWQIANTTSVNAQVAGHADVGAGLQVRFLTLAYTQALDYAWVPDVAAPFSDGELHANARQYVVVEVTGTEAGKRTMDVTLTCGSESFRNQLTLLTLPAVAGIEPLHGNLWPYLHESSHAPVSSALRCDPGFLARYGMDTVVVHPAALQPRHGEYPTDLLRRYMRAYAQSQRILLFMDIDNLRWTFSPSLETAAGGKLPMGWEKAFRAWWHWVQRIAVEEGVVGELLLYPIDEATPKELELLEAFSIQVAKAGIKARIYATANRQTAARMKGVDVIQVHWPALPLASPIPGREVHGYDTRADGRHESPNTYYRRQGWVAYSTRLAGVGFWALWDSSGADDPLSGWNPFGHRERDFGVIYKSPDGCAWPSRRLLAWARGLEENLIVRQCAHKLGSERSNALLRAALDDATMSSATRAMADFAEQCLRQKK